jgi:DNA-binding PadR family transcriptional regulator
MPRHTVSDPVLHILLALSDRPRHGYAIIVEIEERTEGVVRLGTGTIYSALKRLLAEGLIEEAEDPDEASRARGKRTYALSHAGRDYLDEQTERLRLLTAHAIGKGALPGFRRA